MTDQPTGDASERPEDAAPTPPPTPPAAGGTSYDMDAAKASLQGANRLDLGIIVAGVVAWLAGFMPFYTASVSAAGIGASNSGTAYHGFFGWFAVWVALGGALVLAASLFGQSLPVPVRQVVVGAFGLALVCLVLALFIFPGGGCPSNSSGLGFSCDTGRGFGFWLALIAVLAGLGLSVVRMRETTASGATA